MKIATCGVGVGVGAAVGLPTLSLVLDPATRQTVTTPKDPIDVGAAAGVGADWQRIDVIAPVMHDAWVSAQNVVLGAAFVRKRDKVEALSAICPHLGCIVGLGADKKSFLCPCHDSKFGENGDKGSGPSKRKLDTLPIQIVDGRLRLTWVRYKLDTASPEPA